MRAEDLKGWLAAARQGEKEIKTATKNKEVEALVKADPPLIQEAWYQLQGWYKAAVDRAPPPARATLKWITAERVTLYILIPPRETPSRSP